MLHIKTELLKGFDSTDLSGCILLFQSRPSVHQQRLTRVYVHTASSPHLLRFKHRSDSGTFQTVICSRRGAERGGFCSSKTKMPDRGKLMCERELADRQCIVGSFPSFMFWESSTKKPAEAPQEGGGDNEKFDYLSCTLFSAIIHTRN